MIESGVHLPGWEKTTQAATPSPIPPIEGELIRSLLALDLLRVKSSEMFELLRASPRDGARFDALFREAYHAWDDAREAYFNYHSIVSCKGQA